MDYIDRDPFRYQIDERNKTVSRTVSGKDVDDEWFVTDLTLPARFEVCDYCEGDGSHSRHLGAYSADEFDEAFPEDEDRRAYFSGAFDMPCEFCKGNRVMLIPDWDRVSAADRKLWEDSEAEHYAYEQERISEIRMGA